MSELGTDTLAERLAVILLDWHLADSDQFESYKGRMQEIRDIIKTGQITEDELVSALDRVNLATRIARRLLGGNRARATRNE
jgi:hypothetical protein